MAGNIAKYAKAKENKQQESRHQHTHTNKSSVKKKKKTVLVFDRFQKKKREKTWRPISLNHDGGDYCLFESRQFLGTILER